MKLTIWREGEHAYFDWSGTDPQALGPINFYLSEGMFKMFIGIYLIMVNDPQILFNDGFYPLLHVVIPEGCLLQAALPGGARLPHARAGAPVRRARRRALQAGARAEHGGRLRHLPVHALLGLGRRAGEFFYSMEILYGGIPGRPIGDGMDGHSWWPLFENIPTEYLEAYYPMRIDGYTTITDSGGAGFHRGGNGVEKRYVYLEPGEISIHDDRWLTRPWGVLGGQPGERSEKILVRADGTRGAPAVEVRQRRRSSRATCSSTAPPAAAAGRTRSTAPSRPSCATSLRARVAREGARELRRRPERRRHGRPRPRPRPSASASARSAASALAFDFGPPLEEVLANCKAETGLEPPTPGEAAALVAARGRRRGARAGRERDAPGDERHEHAGFGERAGGVGRAARRSWSST